MQVQVEVLESPSQYLRHVPLLRGAWVSTVTVLGPLCLNHAVVQFECFSQVSDAGVGAVISTPLFETCPAPGRRLGVYNYCPGPSSFKSYRCSVREFQSSVKCLSWFVHLARGSSS